MKELRSVPITEVFAEFEQDEAFKAADHQLKPYYDLVKAIIKRRNELGITQKELAEKANTHQSRISKIESAEHDIRLSTLIQIAEALGTEISIQLVPLGEPSGHFFRYAVESSSLPAHQVAEKKKDEADS